jgi:peptide/nickel transport system substrate-binding protein
VAVASLAALPGSSAAEEPPARTAVVGIDYDPPCLNPLLGACDIQWPHEIAGAVLAGAYRERPDFSFEPVLVERVDVAADPFTLTYHIRPDAVWSDGTPVTADDFLFTLDSVRDPYNNATTAAWRWFRDLLTAEKLTEKSLRLVFSRIQTRWQAVFAYVLPKHVLEGHELEAVFLNEIADPDTHEPIGSGPFLLTSRSAGSSLTLTPNPRWWGDTGPYLDRIVFRVLLLSSDQFQGVRDGAVDVLFPQPQAAIADVRDLDGVEVEWREGPAMDHLDFNVGSTEMPLLQHAWFRQAVAYALDRPAGAAAAWETLIPSYPALQSLGFRDVQPEYEPTFADYDYDPAQVASLMTGNGCVPGADGIWVCDGVRASVVVVTTTGNPQRDQVRARMIESARAAGIELVAENESAATLFGVRLPARDYQAIIFTWVTTPGASPREIYTCGGSQNFMAYCSPAVDSLVTAAEETIDPAARASILNDAYDAIAADVPTIPLFARPLFSVRRDRLVGPQVNPDGLATWNVEAWRIASDDETPPTVTCAATPSRIWFHKGKLVPVELDVAVTDEGSGSGGFVLTGVSSDEAGEGDIQGFDVGTADTDGLIRAERDPEGDGRTYTFTYEGADLAGNTATCEATVEIVRRKRGG